MQKKPLVILVLSSTLVIFSFFMSYFALRNLGPVPMANYAVDLWAIAAASMLTAIGVWRVRPWGFFLFLLLVTVVVWRDLIHLTEPPHIPSFQDAIDLAMVAMGLIFIMQKHARTPYFDPRIRWWERPPRHKAELDAKLSSTGDKTEPCQILDISKTGCFIDTTHSLSNGQIIGLDIKANNIEFHSPAKVVRLGTNPKGIGMMFLDTTPENRAAIKEIIKNLKKDASFQ